MSCFFFLLVHFTKRRQGTGDDSISPRRSASCLANSFFFMYSIVRFSVEKQCTRCACILETKINNKMQPSQHDITVCVCIGCFNHKASSSGAETNTHCRKIKHIERSNNETNQINNQWTYLNLFTHHGEK